GGIACLSVAPDDTLTRIDLQDAAIHGVGCRNHVQVQVIHERARIDVPADPATGEDASRMRGEDHLAGHRGITQRLHTKTVTRQQQSASTRVPNRDRKYTSQFTEELLAAAEVKLSDDAGMLLR